MKKSTYVKTLAIINRILKDHGKEPVDKIHPGSPGSMYHCPISQTLLDGSFEKDGKMISTRGSSIRAYSLDFLTPCEELIKAGEENTVMEFIKGVDNRGYELRDQMGKIDPALLLAPRVRVSLGLAQPRKPRGSARKPAGMGRKPKTPPESTS